MTEQTTKKPQEANVCPVCGSMLLEYGVMEPGSNGNSVFYPWTCETCKATGKEYYDLTFSGHEDVHA